MVAIYKKNKNYNYVPPTPPAELIDSTSYILDFVARKFIHIGIDSINEFNTMVHIITSSRYVKITPDFLRRIFLLLGNILSFIFYPPEKYMKRLFLETNQFELTSMVYMSENVLVIDCENQIGCRVLLNRTDLIQLQYLEWCIYESVSRKSNITKPAVLKQFDMFLNYIDQEFTKVKSSSRTNEEIVTFIKNVRDESVIAKNDINFISQLKMYASYQLAKHWAQRWSGGNTPELFFEPEIQPPRYSSMSPMATHDDEDYSQSRENESISNFERSTVKNSHLFSKALGNTKLKIKNIGEFDAKLFFDKFAACKVFE
ncbi:hypothetical protein QTP88_018964 [Uroleucon formosanum]